MLPRILVLAVSGAVLALAPLTADAIECSKLADKTQYNAVLAQMSTCENLTGVKLEWPLADKKNQQQKFCATCTALLETIVTKDAVPDCKYEPAQIKLLHLLQKTFRPCVGGSSASDSMSGSDDDEDGSGSTGGSTGGSAVLTATTKPASTTKAPSTTSKTPTSSSNGTAAGTNGNAQVADSEASSMSLGVIIGIAAGAFVVLALIAVVLVRRHKKKSRRHGESAKFDSASAPDSSTGRASTAQFQLSLVSSGKTPSTGNKSDNQYHPSHSPNFSSASAAPRSSKPEINPWEDTAIIAVRVPKDKVFVNALLSRGGFGEVYQGIYNRQQVAIKMLLPETRKDLDEITALFAEVKLMASLDHDRIVNFVGVAWDSLNDVCVLSEFMEGGDLRGALMRWEEARRPHGFNRDKVKIALHVAHALTYLHSLRPPILHRDLKSKNILLDNQLNAKVTDFGVSRESSYRTMTAGVGTSLWMAPEVMMGERYDEKADIFSFGIVLSELDTHAVPYRQFQESSGGHRIPDTAVLQMVSLGKIRVKFSKNASAEMAELGNACVSLNPKDRPTAADALYTLHNVLKGMYLTM
ncbi:Tkl protein kinase [Globisporangium polare]